MASSSGDRMQRLQLALEALEAWRARGGVSGESEAHFLARNPSLRDLLEPMLADDGGAEQPLADPQPTIAPGATLGDFRLLRQIGKGGMGVVYEALQLSLQRRVALKVLGDALANQPQALARFRREAIAAAKLDHRGIVKVVAIGESDACPFFAMELIEGISLQAVLHEKGKLDPKHASELALQVADALEHAHAELIVHRDVKPANIMLREDGSAVLSDFGLAHVADLPGLTRTGSFAGTACYMAPEQIRSDIGAISPRTDVFSLGVTLYELLTGRRPFGGTTTPEIFHAILHDDPVDLRHVDKDLPEDLTAIVAKAIEKHPADRYASASAFAADLRAFLTFRPITARRPRAGQRLVRWARREPVKAGMSAVAILLLGVAAGLGFYVLGTQEERRLGERKQREDTIELALAEAGVAFVNETRDPKTRSSLKRVLEMDPDNGEAFALLYLAYEKSREPEEIAKLFRDHQALVEKSRPLRRQREVFSWARDQATRGKTVTTADTTPPPGPGEAPGEDSDLIALLIRGTRLSNLAWLTLSKKDGAIAQSFLFKAMLLSPKPRLLFYWLYGDAASLAGDAVAARATSDAIRRMWPASDSTLFYAGSMLRLVDPRAAVEIYAGIVARQPQNATAACMLAYAQGRMGDERGALETLQKVLADHPENARALADISSHYMTLGKYKESIKSAEAAIAADPGIVEPHVNIASAFLRLGKLDKAESHALAALQMAPTLGLAHTSLGAVKLYQKRYPEAEAALTRALEINPDDYFAHYNLAFVHARQGAWDQAIDQLEKAVAIRPDIQSHVLVLEPEYNVSGMQSERGDALFARMRSQQALTSRPTSR